MTLRKFAPLFALAALCACAPERDPCDSGSMFGVSPCEARSLNEYHELIWIDSVAGTSVALDPNPYAYEHSVYDGGGTGEYRWGFLLDPANDPDGCRLAVTFKAFDRIPEGRDTVKSGLVRVVGFRPGMYSGWEVDPSCGSQEFPDGVAWKTLSKSGRFADAEGPKHGRDAVYRLRISWNGNRVDGFHHTRDWTEKIP